MKRRVLINEQQLKNIVLNIIKEERGHEPITNF